MKKMIKVYFSNSNEEERLLSHCETTKEAWGIIKTFLDEHKYKSYYQRRWKDPANEKRTIVDVGSWSEFFYIDED